MSGAQNKCRRRRLRKRRRCSDCGEEYSHSSFYTHKCGANDPEDEASPCTFLQRTALPIQNSTSVILMSPTKFPL